VLVGCATSPWLGLTGLAEELLQSPAGDVVPWEVLAWDRREGQRESRVLAGRVASPKLAWHSTR
jgi:hypothetical protein